MSPSLQMELIDGFSIIYNIVLTVPISIKAKRGARRTYNFYKDHELETTWTETRYQSQWTGNIIKGSLVLFDASVNVTPFPGRCDNITTL